MTVKARAVLTAMAERRRWVTRRDGLLTRMKSLPFLSGIGKRLALWSELRYVNGQVDYYDTLIHEMKTVTRPPGILALLGGLLS